MAAAGLAEQTDGEGRDGPPVIEEADLAWREHHGLWPRSAPRDMEADANIPEPGDAGK